jgi:hypothetical protein
MDPRLSRFKNAAQSGFGLRRNEIKILLSWRSIMDAQRFYEDPDVLKEKLIRIENTLFCLKAKAKVIESWDNSQIERLELICRELRERCQELESKVLRGPSGKSSGRPSVRTAVEEHSSSRPLGEAQEIATTS